MPDAIRRAFTARTRSSTSLNMLLAAIGSKNRKAQKPLKARRLSQFRGRVKEPGMLDQGIAIGHSGNEIGDVAGPRPGIRGIELAPPLVRQLVGLRRKA